MYLILDWDGTVTVRDTLWLLLERFGDRAVFERMEAGLGTTLGHREVMETEMATITAPLDEAVAFLLDVAEIRPGFRRLVEQFHPLVLSSGFHETIEPVLAREEIEVELAANRIDPRPDGWRVLWADDAPCTVCGEPCKRRVLPEDGPVVYVGDGYSDRCAALAAERVFARDGLADYLTSRGAPFEPFEDFDEIAAALT
ncbi:MAG: 2-hydroxy-3-keto-5-methylthiopentenyl-phosphate phosphatase [Gaiellaceae bacterium]|nr:2-hydroxy-3-keto-5-methylthiopentenyl-phosphate phosphatase [Gaiellaceae bacterium]